MQQEGDRRVSFKTRKEKPSLLDLKKGCKPSKVYPELKDSRTSNAKASGNRTGCGVQPTTIRKITCESHQNEYLSKDMVESLLIIRKLFIEKERLQNKPPPRLKDLFIQLVSIR